MLVPGMIPQQEHAPAITQMPGSRAARRGRQCPKAARNRAVGAPAQSIDGAEHSAILFDVMATVQGEG